MPQTPSPAIRLDALRREFRASGRGTVVALSDVTLEVPRGQLVALLGENGAGKTTLVKILSGLLLPTSGTASITGYDVVDDARRARAATSVVLGGDRGLYGMLDATENLRYFGVLAGASRRTLRGLAPELLAEVGLDGVGRRPVQTFSKGQKQRLHVAIGLVTRPPVLLLDEPTVGLDPNEAERLRGVVDGLRRDGTTILLTSHNLLDVQRLADRVVMIARGRITHDLPLADFARIVGHDAVVSVLLAGHVALDAPGVRAEVEGQDTRVTVVVSEWAPSVLESLADLTRGRRVLNLQVRPSSLDEAFALASKGQS